MNKVNYKVVFLWILHGLCMLLLIGSLWTFYRYGGDEYFVSAIHRDSFESTRYFERTVQKNLNSAVEYAALESKFETNGRLNLTKTVEKETLSDGVKHKYCLQDALDFGQAIGIVFNADNRLIILKDQPQGENLEGESMINSPIKESEERYGDSFDEMEISVGDAFNYENYTELLSDQESDQSRENNILLSLLYRLSEYYEYRKILGLRDNEDTNFVYRLVYIDQDGNTTISTNRAEVLDSQSLKQYGSYYWYDSKTGHLDTSWSEALQNRLVAQIGEKEYYKEGVYELMAAVNTQYPMEDSFTKGLHRYQHYSDMIRLIFILSAMLGAGMILSFAAVVLQDDGERHRVDTWYTEYVFLCIFLSLMVVYWGCREIIFAFRTRFVMDLITGIILIILGYLPALYFLISVFRRIRGRDLISGFFTAKMFLYVEQNLRQHRHFKSGLRSLLEKLGIQLLNIVLIVLIMHILHGQKLLYAAILILIALLWNILILGLSSKRDSELKLIFTRLIHMSEGNIGEKLDPDTMSGENVVLATVVNALDDSLEKAVQTRTRSERMQTELIANVSHDLRTPLTSILSYVDLLRREPLPEGRSREYLQVLEDKAYRLKSLAEALMDASRATSGTLTINWVDMDLVQMLNQVVGEFYDRMEDQQLNPVIHLVDPPAMIRADGKLLWRILENLFSNVCKYAKTGTNVYIDMQETPQSFVLTIKNLSARKLTQSAENLTERFIRGDVARTTEGSGLGLSIVKNMTEQLHGKFELFLDGDYFRARLVFPKIEA